MASEHPRATPAPLRLPMPGSGYLPGATMAWQPTEHAGYWIKPLYENPLLGERTLLMKADPGTHSPPHAHEEFEQIYVLEGSFDDGDRTLRAGDYCARPIGAMHSAISEEGFVALLIYSAAGRDGPAT